MAMKISKITYLVRNYEEAISYFVEKLGFQLIENSQIDAQKRWVVVQAGQNSVQLLLARAVNEEQLAALGNQAGGRVGFFLQTDDFIGTFERMRKNGVEFIEEPRQEIYGKVVVFMDLYGNLWDLLE